MSRETPEEVLKSVVDGINTGNLEGLMTLYEPEAAFVTEPGKCVYGSAGIREFIAGVLDKNAIIDLKVTSVTEAGGPGARDLGLVIYRNGPRRQASEAFG